MVGLAPLFGALVGCGGDSTRMEREGAGGNEEGASGGTSASSGAGGSSGLGGGPSDGGTSGVGASGTGAGGSGIGGASGVGGVSGAGGTPEGACIETLTPYDPRNPRGIEITDVEGILAGSSQARLTWSDGSETDVDLTLVGLSTHVVESRPDPDFDGDVAVICQNYLRIMATGQLRTSDGRLDETLPGMEFDFGSEQREGSSLIVARAVATIDREKLRGSYAPELSANECFRSLDVQVTRGYGFEGSIVESIGSMPCDSDANEAAVFARHAGRWGCGDTECSFEIRPALVVEAESCEGIGVQVTQAGDEATFSRSGDTITRTEDFGCGCALFSDFVVAWAPSSPLELRLCEHDSRNTCLAACLRPLSYDLSTAFGASGASEFNFVD